MLRRKWEATWEGGKEAVEAAWATQEVDGGVQSCISCLTRVCSSFFHLLQQIISITFNPLTLTSSVLHVSGVPHNLPDVFSPHLIGVRGGVLFLCIFQLRGQTKLCGPTFDSTDSSHNLLCSTTSCLYFPFSVHTFSQASYVVKHLAWGESSPSRYTRPCNVWVSSSLLFNYSLCGLTSFTLNTPAIQIGCTFTG